MLLILTFYFQIILIPLTFRLKTKCKIVAISNEGKKVMERNFEKVFEIKGHGYANKFINFKQCNITAQSIVAFVTVEMDDDC